MYCRIACISTCSKSIDVSSSAFSFTSGLLLDKQLNTLLQIMLRLFSTSVLNGSKTYSKLVIAFILTFTFGSTICLQMISMKWLADLYCMNSFSCCNASYFTLLSESIRFFQSELLHCSKCPWIASNSDGKFDILMIFFFNGSAFSFFIGVGGSYNF